MKRMTIESICIALVLLAAMLVESAVAQGLDDPLTIQGLQQTTLHSAVARAMGGITIGMRGNAALMFSNPSLLQSIQDVQVSIGSNYQRVASDQTQSWIPNPYYGNFSLLMESLTGSIKDPVIDTARITIPNGNDKVWRPFDDIGPNWSRTKNVTAPVFGFIAMPFSVGSTPLSVGVGYAEYANLNHFYQNNNVLSPSVGTYRPIPISQPKANDTIPVQWFQYSRLREGSINGYGAALSVGLSDQISLGISGMMLKGTSDDAESRTERGLLRFNSSFFTLDSIYNHVSKNGTSDYSGVEFILAATYRSRALSFGFILKPPTKISRSFHSNIQSDTTGQSALITTSGSDALVMPWRYSIGLTIEPRDYLTIGIEYEVRPYASAIWRTASGVESNPWLSSALFRGGVEYRPADWLILRGGVQEQAETFEPAEQGLIGEPVTYSIYTMGIGLSIAGAHIDIAYEYSEMKYQDVWQSNTNSNRAIRTGIMANITYEIFRQEQ
jgi:hypothetical protein